MTIIQAVELKMAEIIARHIGFDRFAPDMEPDSILVGGEQVVDAARAVLTYMREELLD